MNTEEKAYNEFFKSEAYKRFDEDRKLGLFSPKKGNNMTEQVQTKEVTLTPEQEQALVQALEQDGKVLVQTADEVGVEQTQPTVH